MNDKMKRGNEAVRHTPFGLRPLTWDSAIQHLLNPSSHCFFKGHQRLMVGGQCSEGTIEVLLAMQLHATYVLGRVRLHNVKSLNHLPKPLWVARDEFQLPNRLPLKHGHRLFDRRRRPPAT